MSITTTLRDKLGSAFKNKSAPQKPAHGYTVGPTVEVPVPTAANQTLWKFQIRENQLCAQLGLSKDELRRRRLVLLVQGAHWDYIDKRVLLNALGAEILRKTAHSDFWALDLHGQANGRATADCEAPRVVKALLPEKNPAPIVFAGELIVWAMPKQNSRLLIAYLPGTDPSNPLNLVTCLVRSNLNFLRGQKMPGPGRQVKQLDEQRYELLGEPPRYRGRW